MAARSSSTKKDASYQVLCLINLIVDPGAPALPSMRLFGVIVGDIDDPDSWSRYPFTSKGNPVKVTPCTVLWRG